MPRLFTAIDCGLWDDLEFVALSAGAQRTYLMLISQREITACGSLPLTLRRWARTCPEQDLQLWLAELSDARFVVIDEDSEELLVRTFAKWDGGYKHAIRRKAVISSARSIRSCTLRDIAVEELARLGVSTVTPHPSESYASGTTEAVESQRFPVNLGDQQGEPGEENLERGARGTPLPPPMFCDKHPEGTDKPCGPCKHARMRYQRHVNATAGIEAEARAARAAAIAACRVCDEHGRRLGDRGRLLGACDHVVLAAVGGGVR